MSGYAAAWLSVEDPNEIPDPNEPEDPNDLEDPGIKTGVAVKFHEPFEFERMDGSFFR